MCVYGKTTRFSTLSWECAHRACARTPCRIPYSCCSKNRVETRVLGSILSFHELLYPQLEVENGMSRERYLACRKRQSKKTHIDAMFLFVAVFLLRVTLWVFSLRPPPPLGGGGAALPLEQFIGRERDEVRAALWSHVCIVVVMEDPPPRAGRPPPWLAGYPPPPT